MAKQSIDIGVEGNDATGDSIRESFRKVNENFTELYAVFGRGGAISFTTLDDTPDTLIGNTSKVPVVNGNETGIGLYSLVSDAGTNDPTDPDNTINFVVDHDNEAIKVRAINTKLSQDAQPTLSQELNANAAMAYSVAINNILTNEGSGADIDDLVADWNATHPDATDITTDNILISKGYGDLKYVNVSGDTMTGHLETIAGATGNQVPRVNEVLTLAGSDANRTMQSPLYLSDHPGALAGAGTPNGQEDLQAASKYYVDNTSFTSNANLFVSTQGDDRHKQTPAGKEGRSIAFSYRSINAAAKRAEQIIEATPFEPGPYIQTITYNDGADNSDVTAVGSYISESADSLSAQTAINNAREDIIQGVIDFIDTSVANASVGSIWYKFTYQEEVCRRDTGLILDAVIFDLRSGGNYLSIFAGKRYGASPSGLFAITTQGAQTRAAITRAKTLTATELTNAGVSAIVTTANTRFDDVLSFLDTDTSNDVALIQGNNYTIDIDNGGTAAVDQGDVSNPDLIPGKLVVGRTSGAKGIIIDFDRQGGADTGKDRITLDLVEAKDFEVGEELEFGNRTRNNQITIFVESGIYDEELPIKLPENVSLKGDEFRRCVIRPAKGVSTSKYAATYFYRDSTIDGLTTASAGTLFTHPRTGDTGRYGRHYLHDPANPVDVSDFGEDNPGDFTNAAELVRLNKAFIQEEVIEYTDATYPSLTYTEATWRTDIGLTVDALVADLKSGGREKNLKQQGKFFKEGNYASATTEIVAAIQHITTLATNILQNDSGDPYAKLGTVDQVFIAGTTAEANAQTNLDALVDLVAYAFDSDYNPPKNNSEMDVLLCNDGTIVRNITVQKHGGFMMVLDPEGQILTRSPYAQTNTSFSQSKGETRSFAGGMFMDGYCSNLPLQITGKTNNYVLNVRTDPALTNDGLFVRRPVTPCPFFIDGKRYQVNAVSNYNQTTGTATLTLDETSNESNGYTASSFPADIFLQSGGNRSMLANDFTQINDLGYGAVVINNAVSELVSVFTYYCYTGYLADKGSQIRSLSGNNSYGTYGLVSAGADPDEIPTTVTLDGNMVFPVKVFNGDYKYTFASALPATVAVGETIQQSVTNYTAIVSYITDDRKCMVVRNSTGQFDLTNDILEDDSSSTARVPATATKLDLSAEKDDLFVYAYDLDGYPLNVSEIEIFHPVSTDATDGLYQPYEVTNATRTSFVMASYAITNSEYTYTGTGGNDDATFTIAKNATDGYTVTLTGGGTGYAASETFTILGSELGGTDVTHNATVTIDTVSAGVIQTLSVTGTANLSASDPKIDGQVWKLNLGTGIEGTASNGIQALTPHNTEAVFRHKQNFLFNDVGDPPTRPSTAVQFVGDPDSSTTNTYRTIGFNTAIVTGTNVTGDDRVVTFDANFDYIDLTVDQDLVTTAENAGTISPAITGAVANKTLGSNTGGSGTTNDTHIVIGRVDADDALRLNTGQMLLAWGGKVHTIVGYTERVIGSSNVATIELLDVAGSEINGVATLPGIGTSLEFDDGITLKAGLADGESAEITVNISTCRATSHDMLDIGTGGYNTTNYPDRIYGAPVTNAVSSSDAIDSTGTASKAQTQERNKGRVFAVLTDQDGFFRVGRFFTVDQGTGSVTFNAALVLTNIDGIGFKRGVRVNEFSNDDTFAQPKGDAVPTQTAVYNYINYRLGRDEDGQNVAAGDIIPPGGGYLYKAGDTMNGQLDMGGNALTNLPAPTTGSAAATKDYVDGKTDNLGDIGDVTLEAPPIAAADILIFTGTDQNSENATVSGDIAFTRDSANSITAAISSGVIVNADIAAAGTAEIAHTKLALNYAQALAAEATGTPIDIRDASGIVSFLNTQFDVTANGFASIKNGGISNDEIANSTIANAKLANSGITLAADSGTNETVDLGNTLTIAGTANQIETTVGATDTVTIDLAETIVHAGGTTGTITTESGTPKIILKHTDGTGDASGDIEFKDNAGDVRGSISYSASDQLIINAGGTGANNKTAFNIGSTEIAVNPDGDNALDFRVESNTVDSAIFVDASADRIGIGTETPTDAVQITLGNVIPAANSGTDSGQNLGASGNKWNTVYATVFSGTATQAQYADLAENYLGDADYEPGTVLVFGGDAEVTACTAKGDHRAAGIVTTNPAHLMNSHLKGDHVVGLALQGRVPCKVIGTVKKGDMLVTSAVPGYAIVNNSPGIGQVIGKAVGVKDTEDRGTVEVVVGRV